MSAPGDAMGPAQPVASTPAAPPASPIQGDGAPDDRDVRRVALRDLAAMIGVEVFY